MTETMTALRPESLQELQALVLVAGEKGYGLKPLYTGQILENHSTQTLPLDISRLNRVIAFDPKEAFITAEAGCTVKQLSDALMHSNWQLPFLFPEQTTLFDIFSQPWPGFRQVQKFPLAHWVTGIKAVTGNVQLVEYGGPVMKNVTGYDMNRLFIGSQSVFGLISSLTIRLIPKARQQRVLLLDFQSYPEALQFIEEANLRAHTPTLDIACLHRLKSLFSWKLLLGFSGVQQELDERTAQVQGIYQAKRYSSIPVESLSAQQLMDTVAKLHWPDTACQFSMPYSQAIRQAQLFHEMDTLDAWWNVLSNTLGVHLSGSLVDNPNSLVFMKNTIESAEGIIHTHADLETNYHTILDTAQSGVTQRWMRELKNRFDPHNVLPAIRV